MKILCITGSAQRDLDRLLDMFHVAGLARETGAAGNRALDMRSLQMQMSAARAQSANLEPPGRLWDTLASEIFLANMHADSWGWADARSADFLDFWLAFESRICFVLVWSCASHALALALASGCGADAAAHILSEWEARQERILRFHQRHPERCLLLNMTQCLTHGADMIAQAAVRLHLRLRTGQALPAPTAGEDPALLFFAHQISSNRTQVATLEQALAGAALALGPSPSRAPMAPTVETALADYQRQRVALSDALALAEARAVDLAALTMRLRDTENSAARQSADLLAELQQLRIDITSQSAQHQQHSAEWSRARAAWQEERQGLFTQIQEAEKRQGAATLAAATSRQLQETELELELALKQRQRVAEECAHYAALHESTLARARSAESTWRDFLQRTPDYYHYASLSVTDTSGNGTLDWHIAGLETASPAPADLHFQTQYGERAATLVFSPAVGDAAPLRIGETDVEKLSDMGASDWRLLRTLLRIALAALSRPGQLGLSTGIPAALLHQSVERLAQRLAMFDHVLRFDRASLKRAQANVDYEHLWIQLDQLSCGARHWPVAEFRLACANVRPDHFGSHPKLEFPRAPAPCFLEHWWDESADDFGSKLELRFALPDAIDLGVWQRLSAQDHQLLLALIARLPAILTRLQASPPLPRPWADWHTLAGQVQAIAAQLVTAPTEGG